MKGSVGKESKGRIGVREGKERGRVMSGSPPHGKKKEGGGTGDIWRTQHMLYRCGYHMYVE